MDSKIKKLIPSFVTYNSIDGMPEHISLIGKPLNSTRAKIKMPLNPFDSEYLSLCEQVLNFGIESSDRTGVGTISSFGHHLKFDLRVGFPILTTKKINIKHAINELLFLYSDKCNNVKNLPEESRFLWQPWADENGNLGSIYGMNVREWKYFDDKKVVNYSSIDQLKTVISDIKNNPNSRRHIITNWKVDELPNSCLPPCHGLVTQFYVRNGELSCQMYQRSADICIGLPYNIIHYAILNHIIASLTNLKVGDLSICLGDAHIYLNHVEGIKEQLSREPFPAPTLKIIKQRKSFDSFKSSDFELQNYQHHNFIKFEVAV